MKQRQLFVLLFLFLSTCFLYAQPKGYRMEFKIDKYQGDKALIAYHFGDKQYIMDTLDRTPGGTFVMQADTVLRGGLYLFVLPPRNNYFEFLVDSKDNQRFTLETDTTNFVENMKVTGSKQNQVFFEDVKFISKKRQEADKLQADIKAAGSDSAKIKPIQAKLKDLDKEVVSKRNVIIQENPAFLYTAMLKSTKEPEIPEAPKGDNGKPLDSLFAYKYYKSHYWEQINFGDDRLLRTPILLGKLNQYLDKVCSPTPDSLVKETRWLIQQTEKGKSFEMYKFMVVTLLNKYANSKRMGDDAVYVEIAFDHYCTGKAYAWTDSAQVKKICDRAMRLAPTLVGKQAPEVRIMDDQERWQSLYDVKADYTVLYFWDYNCGHCKKVTPKIVKIAEHYLGKGANVKFYMVQTAGTREEWKKKAEEYGMMNKPGIINTSDPSRMTGFDQKYDILSTPRTFVLDKDKKIIAKYISARQCDEILNHYLYKIDQPSVIFEEEEEGHDEKH